MKHVVILLIIAATAAGCAHRVSRYGYEAPGSHTEQRK
jgi:hypothetical protein